jgi:hypothetical protein
MRLLRVMGNTMWKALNLMQVLLLMLISCNNSTVGNKENFIEGQPSFFELRHGDWLMNEWIRKPENLLTVHETFKRVGYTKIIHDDLLRDAPFILQDLYINRPGKLLLDSLEWTYNESPIKGKYFREFWQRRKNERNDSIVHVIIKDINRAIQSTLEVNEPDIALVNDTLFKLLQIEYEVETLNEKLAIKHFETLRHLGFHQSAYNLLFEDYQYHELNWNKDSLAKTLNQSDKVIHPWFQDNTK